MIIVDNNKNSSNKLNSKSDPEINSNLEIINPEQEKIIDWLEKVKFKNKMIGGVDEQDVWKKIHELNEMYEAALKAERIRYDVLLQEQKKCESNPQISQSSKESSSYE